jgi:signal peptidase I
MKTTKKTKQILVFSTICFATIFGSFQVLKSSGWYFAYEQQPYLRCLPYEISLMNKKLFNESHIKRDSLVVVKTDKYQDFYKDDIELLKVIVGLPGDVVDMRNNLLTINNKVFGSLMRDEKFQPFTETKFSLSQGQYFVIGTSKTALDSRIIGPVSSSDIVGFGYALL